MFMDFGSNSVTIAVAETFQTLTIQIWIWRVRPPGLSNPGVGMFAALGFAEC